MPSEALGDPLDALALGQPDPKRFTIEMFLLTRHERMFACVPDVPGALSPRRRS